MVLLYSISNNAWAQQWKTLFSVESRVGYSTNTYLNPYYTEWDRTENNSFGIVSGIAQTSWMKEGNEINITGSAVFEPIFGATENWKGGLLLGNYRRSVTQSLSAGLETGGSYFESSFTRCMLWIQPKVTWSMSPFSELKLKAGSNFRSYRNYVTDGEPTDPGDRSDLYAIEFETWPTFRWQFTGGVYGNVDALPAIQDGVSTFTALGHVFRDGSRIKIKLGLEQYQNEQTITVDGGGLPIGGGPSKDTERVSEVNRIFRLGVQGNMPISEQLMAFAGVEGLRYESTDVEQNVHDIQVSAGIRLSIQPRINKHDGRITPEWKIGDEAQRIQVEYSGNSQLYLVGDFNNWKRPGIPLDNIKDDNYMAKLKLDAGAYEYKILKVENGEEAWIEFSENTYTVDDGFDGENAMLLVE